MYNKLNKEARDGFLPIGTPSSNTLINIVNPTTNRLQPFFAPGEIIIGGDCVSQGYTNKDLNTPFQNSIYYNTIFYHTGDYGYIMPDGNICFLGRIDKQVKINGHRIELQEIDKIIQAFNGVEKSISVVNNNKIITYVVSNEALEVDIIKKYAKDFLPSYMMPNKIVLIDSIPMTMNGKVDFKKLLEFNNTIPVKKILLPTNFTEKTLYDIFINLLDISNFSITDNFFDIGGDSLSAIKLSLEILNSFNVEISVKSIFEHSSIKELANLIKAQAKETANNLEEFMPSESRASYPVSSAQKRIYYSSLLAGNDSILYNTSGALILDKLPNIKKLENAFIKLIQRQKSLRTYFEIENNSLVQKIEKKIEFQLDYNADTIPEDEIDICVKKYITPFDLSKAPLLNAKIQLLANKKALLIVNMHHIICDGTSLAILLDELCKLYNDEELPEMSMHYTDYAVWESNKQASNEFIESKSYWVNQFKNNIPVLDLPTVYSRPAIQSFNGKKVSSIINEELTQKINSVAHTLKVTPYMLLLSVYYVLLCKYSNQNEIVVGSPIVNRPNAEFYNIIGMFVNTMPIKANVDSNLPFIDFLNSIKELCLENYKYQDYPFDELVSDLNIQRDTSRNPLFDTMFTYQNNGYPSVNLKDINATYYIPDNKNSKFDLSLEVVPESNILNLNFEYATSLFNKDYISTFATHYINILKAVLENINIKISDISMLSVVEKNKIIYEFNNTQMDYPRNKTIVELFEEQVQKTPDAIAIVFNDKSLTYKELNEKANSLAYYLRNNKNINKNDIVGVMVTRSFEMIIALLAVLKAGAAYIPIDPEYPQDRIEYMLDHSKAKLLLTQEKLKDTINYRNVECVDLSYKNIYSLNDQNLKIINVPEDLIYVIYTSGSTGKPKGVALKHKNIVNFIYATLEKIDMTSKNTMVSITTISFDIFVLESFLPLLNGIKIIIAPEEAQTDARVFNELCLKNNVDIIQTTPSRMQALLYDETNSDFIKRIKYLLIGGEPFPNNLLEKLHEIYHGKIFNMYGPTETAVWSSIKDLSDISKINIGTPIGNTQMYVLDTFKKPLPVYVPGELYIAGDGLARGYLNNDDLTSKAFVPNPFIEHTLMYKTGDLCKLLPNGEIEYLQRVDNQIKIRGLRIELGEIENRILLYPNIKKACVIKQTINNRDFISAYIIANKRINISELRTYLSKYLPKYMVPSYFTAMDSFPYTPNGKINKKELPLPKEVLKTSESNTFEAPKTDLEKQFVKIWENILNIKPIGINDNFFELGGDSILAMNLNIELKNITNSISYADIFKFPTIKELIKKSKSKDDNYDFNYMEKNYEKYTDILNKSLTIPKLSDLKYKSCENVLLTGATGFLGIHVLDSLLKNEKGKIYCLVREEPGLTPQAKLLQKLNYYFDDKYNKLLGTRIFAVAGDITKSGFGLNQEELLVLANEVSIVINTAAKVSHFGDYPEFHTANVKSVQNLIDFCKSFNKKLYHISTLSVSGNALESMSTKQSINHTTYFAENNLYIGQSLENVYIRSKFEAECIVLDGIIDGLDAYILRVGNLMPRLKDGMFQENIKDNAFINRISGFISLGIIPDYIKDEYLEFTPIDTISNAITKIITHPNINNRIFHLFNHNHIRINKCIKYFKELNPELKIVPETEFKQLLNSVLKNKKKKNMLNNLINDLDSDLHLLYKTDIIIKSDTTIKYLSKIRFTWNKISDKYMKKFIELLRRNL